jgi:hemerythrin superfamily protein
MRISDLIKKEHRELEDSYSHIVASSDTDERIRHQNLFVWQLARHAVGEELVVYPAVEKNVEGGKALAEKERAETQKVAQAPILAVKGTW